MSQGGCHRRATVATAWKRRSSPDVPCSGPAGAREQTFRLKTKVGLFLGRSHSLEKLSGALHNAGPLGASRAWRPRGGLGPRKGRGRCLRPEKLKGHSPTPRSFGPQQPEGRKAGGAVVRESLPWRVPFPLLRLQSLYQNKDCSESPPRAAGGF